jgi:hypothetical protein
MCPTVIDLYYEDRQVDVVKLVDILLQLPIAKKGAKVLKFSSILLEMN